MQEWVKATRAKICVVFEGRDTAGKGGTIKRITERVSPRVFRVVALPTPTEREKTQMYMQRYVTHFPAAGEVDHLRPQLVQPGRCREGDGLLHARADRALPRVVPPFEKAMVDSGIILIKYWLEVGPEEQTRRLESRIDDPRKIWKLSADGPAVLQPLVRLLPGPRRHVRGLGLRVGALVPRVDREQEAGPAELLTHLLGQSATSPCRSGTSPCLPGMSAAA